ncbi:MAG: hypothetical protein APF80_16240 [Alphaproteobacteria bacterium BRH_c36]|nr:MAG: hypothetical protein APF80_16240 [Alphaproteobacteria bacterium BRH_c36]
MKSSRQLGWLSSFLALFTVGLAKPGKPVEMSTAIASGPELATAEPAGTAPEVTRSQSLITLKRLEKPIDWEKAREFQLSARLSVNTQLNRPKFIRPAPRKDKTLRSAEMRWNVPSKTAMPVHGVGLQSAVVITFPVQVGDDKLARAA